MMAEEEARPGSSQSGGASEPTSREDAVGGELAPHSDSGDSGSLFGDMDDLFDAVDEVEDSATAQAFEEGRLKGREEGIVEGRELGVAKGTEIGRELGFYAGCVAAIRQTIHGDVTNVKLHARVHKVLARLEGLIVGYPLDDPINEEILDRLQRIRAAFKVVTSLLKLRDLVFDPKARHAAKNMAF